MKIARISKGIFGKSQCNTEMSTVIPINLKRGGHVIQLIFHSRLFVNIGSRFGEKLGPKRFHVLSLAQCLEGALVFHGIVQIAIYFIQG